MVVAPGLIVYERLLDAFCGKLMAGGNGSRDFATSDMARLPTCSCPRRTANGVCLCARQCLQQGRDRPEGHRQRHDCHHQLAFAGRGRGVGRRGRRGSALGAPLEPQQVVAAVLPLTPGRATGNSLDVLDRRYARGNVLEFLAGCPS
jgi:type III restriction enzyme